VRLGRQRIRGNGACGVIECLTQPLLLQQRLAQSEMRLDFLIVFLQYLTIQLLGPLIVARAQRLLRLVESALIISKRGDAKYEDDCRQRAGPRHQTEGPD